MFNEITQIISSIVQGNYNAIREIIADNGVPENTQESIHLLPIFPDKIIIRSLSGFERVFQFIAMKIIGHPSSNFTIEIIDANKLSLVFKESFNELNTEELEARVNNILSPLFQTQRVQDNEYNNIKTDIDKGKERIEIRDENVSEVLTSQPEEYIYKNIQNWESHKRALLKEKEKIQQNLSESSPEESEAGEDDRQNQRLKKIEDEIEHINKVIASIKSSEDAGMTHQHSLSLVKFASANDIIVIWRPINKSAADKLGSKINPYVGKGLNMKGKSSEFGPISGDVPFEAGLSKLLLADPRQISEFNQKNMKLIKSSEEIYQDVKADISEKNLNDLNELLLVKKIEKRTQDGRLIYYFLDANNEIVTTENNTPLFAVQKRARHGRNRKAYKWFSYDENSKNFTKELAPARTWQSRPVEIMGYLRFIVDNQGEIQENVFPVTADYDELVSAARKIYPWHNNDELPTKISKELFEKFTSQTVITNKEKVNIAAELIVHYEDRLKREHRDTIISSQQPHMGSVNDWQRATKAYLKLELGDATNHGPEVNNPFPEKFSEGDYIVYLPDGNIIVLHNEQEICNFINAQRKNGFPLDVNPKWGWEINNDSRELFIPEHRFDWDGLHKAIDTQARELQYEEEALTVQLNKVGLKDTPKNRKSILAICKFPLTEEDYTKVLNLEWLEPKNEEENLKLSNENLVDLANQIDSVNILAAQHGADRELIDKEVAIRRLELEPDIIYSTYINNRGQTSASIEQNEQKTRFREVISKPVMQMELEWRNKELERYREKAKLLKTIYVENYRVPSIIQEYEVKFASEPNVLRESVTIVSDMPEITEMPSSAMLRHK